MLRQEVDGFTWSDDGSSVCITIQLQEAVPREQVCVSSSGTFCVVHCGTLHFCRMPIELLAVHAQVHAMFGDRSVEVWALGNKAYHLHVPVLYSHILPEKCRFKVSSKRLRVNILLQKRASLSWRFLKG
jgi:hypothetical protein